ncbi:hypothetical protein ABEV41_00655 [Geobacillus thermodenitrificans]|jgi:hypothetical protein|uniref:hypothetical protein n=1 Tax=Geobacillus thermodenitrificans TaxID=33940 RepID=UPI003D1F0A5A
MKIVELKLICVIAEGEEYDFINDTLSIGTIKPVNALSIDGKRKVSLEVIDYEIENVSEEAC